MRDIERIHVVTKAIEECWRDFPDMRFTQLMDNIFTYNERMTRTVIWNMEEDKLLECIKKFREDNVAKAFEQARKWLFYLIKTEEIIK